MKCQFCFVRKLRKKYFKMSSAKKIPRVLSVRVKKATLSNTFATTEPVDERSIILRSNGLSLLLIIERLK